MNRLGKLPLMHQPGEKYTYGLNTDLLGCLVEVISGSTLDDFFRTRIFEPLGMKDTYFYVPKEKAARLVNLYTEDAEGHLQKSTKTILNGNQTFNISFKQEFTWKIYRCRTYHSLRATM